MSFNYIIPIVIIIISNVIYHITTKSIPKEVNSFLSLTVTYLTATVVVLAMYFLTSKQNKILTDIHKLNWTSYVVGLAIVGVEIGFLYMYRLGWDISKGSLITSVSLAILLIIIGALFYKEHIGLYQIVGIAFCLVGLIFVNLK